MSTQRHQPHRQSLNYYQQSPVRGQLEPISQDDGYTRTGWRWLQCTDTPNELRVRIIKVGRHHCRSDSLQVLLPPRTALLYSHLLRTEATELANGRAPSWHLILQIRHLKDRMIRKCQRLARSSTTATGNKTSTRAMFFALHAPPDFRLKEMERWFKSQGTIFAEPTKEPPPTTPYCCSKCGPLGNPPQTQSSSHRRAPSMSSRPTQPAIKPTSQLNRSASERVRRPSAPPSVPIPETKPTPVSYKHRQPKPPVPVPHRYPSVRSTSTPRQQKVAPSPPKPFEHPHPPRTRPPPFQHETRVEPQPFRAITESPEPLPIPYRSPEEREQEIAPDLESEHEARPVSSSPLSYVELAPEPEVPPREPSPTSTLVDLPPIGTIPFPSSGQPLETIHEKPEGSEVVTRPPLVRRRSSLKNGGVVRPLSVVSQTKSVTWAMDREWVEQMTKYEKATQEAEAFCEYFVFECLFLFLPFCISFVPFNLVFGWCRVGIADVYFLYSRRSRIRRGSSRVSCLRRRDEGTMP